MPRGEDSKPHTGGRAEVTEIGMWGYKCSRQREQACRGGGHSISTPELPVIQNVRITDSCTMSAASVGCYPRAMAEGVGGSIIASWERQDRVWILGRPLWLPGGERISGAVLWLGQV